MERKSGDGIYILSSKYAVLHKSLAIVVLAYDTLLVP